MDVKRRVPPGRLRRWLTSNGDGDERLLRRCYFPTKTDAKFRKLVLFVTEALTLSWLKQSEVLSYFPE
jgi:hypothetical protein